MVYEQYKVANPIIEIPELDESKIVKFYAGKDHNCRCGCGGAYYYDQNNRMWKREMTKFHQLLEHGCIREVEIAENQQYINIAYGRKEQNRCYCFYFNK